ncbi:uncharacterized protein A1O5_01837 [Cladophialophora psammophila CBS 110553]|uniref:Uncharacterized protein n=1 Tax=Cladophialophora psammophila CBS 110553 TaxID=1182543 RepID=W9XDU4_9EURO|nr:uncharacterized protein A1O5_01837 [Cladophialophora psammophila CBS 110553]EXJ75141.1 hypothetical protein A1O5_01837 [Cladophialophora psammophila CBS 110553]
MDSLEAISSRSLFLETSCFVQAVVRSEAKAKRVMNDFPDFERSSLDFSIVPDITAPGAFDQCIKDAPPLDVIIRAASPFKYTEAKTHSDSINPAIHGTTEILKSAAKEEGTSGDLSLAYWASKTFAEQAEFMKTQKPSFELGARSSSSSTRPSFTDLSGIALIRGPPVPEDFLHVYVAVRDLSFAHYQTAFAPGVGGRRFLVTPGSNSNQEICDILRKEFPELDEKIPLGRPGQHALPAGSFKIDNWSSQKELGVTYRPFETTVADTARNLLEMEKALTAKA